MSVAHAATATATSEPVPMSTRSGGLVDEHVRAARHAGRGPLGGAVEHRDLLAREQQRGRAGAVEVHAPRGGDLVGVGGPDHTQPGHRAQRRELLDRLVRRAVFADRHRVVRPHERDLRLHDRGEAHGGTA